MFWNKKKCLCALSKAHIIRHTISWFLCTEEGRLDCASLLWRTSEVTTWAQVKGNNCWTLEQEETGGLETEDTRCRDHHK